MTTTTPAADHADEAARFWEAHHQKHDPVCEPRTNARLTEIAADLAPGTALDLGCGRGGDTIWLARRGWRVTAVDISGAATARLSDRASALGLSDLVTTERHDLARSFPDGRFDLISAHYLHTPFDLPRDHVLRTAAAALNPDGRLLVVDHGSIAPWSWNQDPDTHFPTPQQTAADLDLDPAAWTVDSAQTARRIATGPAGRTAEVTDHILLVRRTR